MSCHGPERGFAVQVLAARNEPYFEFFEIHHNAS
jgi:hypothetical protein